jgi:hypothetical protein
VDNPHELLDILPRIPPRQNHTFEIIQKRKPCKICMDFDSAAGLPTGFKDRGDFTARVEAALGSVMQADFGITMDPADYVWVFTDYKTKPKFSAHLVVHKVMPDGKLLCVPHHEKGDTHDGSKYFFNRLLQQMPELDGGLLDSKIYSSDREFRLPGATKEPNGDPLKAPLDQYDTWKPGTAYIATGHNLQEAMVGYLGTHEPHVLSLPTADRSAGVTTSKKKGNPVSAKGPPPGLTLGDGEARMLQLICRQHPTAYKVPLSGKDVFDRDNATRFNHSDCSEKCWCRKAHKSNNYAAWFSGNDAWVHCFGCNKQHKIGCLEDDLTAPEDIEIDCRWLTRLQGESQDPHLSKLNEQLSALLAASIKVLCLQSVMGSGKTTLLKSLINELADRLGVRRVLIITYRQSLSLNMLADLEELGFINYLHAQEDKIDLSSQERVIVQLDSIAKVCQGGRLIPKFDLEVLDENESTLHHATAKTHKHKQGHTFQTFCSIVKSAERLLVMDAFLGAETRAFLKSLGLPYSFVRNTWRPEPRLFKLTNNKEAWRDSLVEALRAGKNVALPSMSSGFMHTLHTYLVENGTLAAHEILLYDAETDDVVKRRVQMVNQDWVNYRLVMWSPSVESGVNFDIKGHFHCMFLVMCSGANTPLGCMQMTGRVRHLGCLTVHTYCSHLGTGKEGRAWTPVDAAHYFRWADNLEWPEEFKVQLNFSEEKLDSGALAVLPKHDTALIVAAHNYARIINSRSWFLLDWQQLLEHAGHKFDFDNWCRRKQPKEEEEEDVLPRHDRNAVLLAAKPIDAKEAKQLLVLQLSAQATRGQKQALARYYYCQAWGISNEALDEEFLAHHHAYDEGASALKVLHAALTPRQPGGCRLAEDGEEMLLPLWRRGKVLCELLQAMRIENVLDGTANSCALTPQCEIMAAVKACAAFRSPEDIKQTEHLFGLDGSTSGFKTVGYMAKRIAVLFESAGLKADVVPGKKKQVKKVKFTPYTLNFNTATTRHTAELFKLRYLEESALGGVNQWWSQSMHGYLMGMKVQLTEKYMPAKFQRRGFMASLVPVEDSL